MSGAIARRPCATKAVANRPRLPSWGSRKSKVARDWAAQTLPLLPGCPLDAAAIRQAPWLFMGPDGFCICADVMDGVTLLRMQLWAMELSTTGYAGIGRDFERVFGVDRSALFP
jgi:hypothetical protein